MKKTALLIAFLALILCSVFALSACSDKEGDKTPSSRYEKVRTAFNGVESSLKRASSRKSLSAGSSDNNVSAKMMAKSIGESSLSKIYDAMVVEERTDDPSFEYDEPPMIQFQYLKALYEEMGEGLEFGKKYKKTMTGRVYYDFKNRTEKVEDEFLTDYSFTCSIVLDIDDNDLITASVGFDLTFTTEGVSRHEKMYAELSLDYDMNDSSPTYELSMYAITDLLDYQTEDEKYFNEEYDYVKVDRNTIKEWRKFGICSPTAFSENNGNDLIYKYSVLRAFKDSAKYKITNFFNKDASLISAVIDCLDVSAVVSRYESFFASEGDENDKLKTVVDKFSRVYGRDIVNDLVYTGATEPWDGGYNPVNLDDLYLCVVSESDLGDPVVYQNYSLISLFDPNGNVSFGDKEYRQDHFSVCLKNGNDVVSVYNDFGELTVKVRSTAYDRTEWVEVNGNEYDAISSFVARSGFNQGYYESEFSAMTLEFDISMRSDPDVKLRDEFRITLINDDACKEVLGIWSLVTKYIDAYAPISGAIPKFDIDGAVDVLYLCTIYEINDGYFDGKESFTVLSGRIGYASEDDLSKYVALYKNKLKDELFVENSYYSTYTKRISDEYVLKLTVRDAGTDFEFIAEAKPEKTVTDALYELIDMGSVEIPDFPGDYEYNVTDNNIRVMHNSETLIGDYVSSLGEYGFVIDAFHGYTSAYKYVDGTLLRIRDLVSTIAVEKVNVALTLVGDFNGWTETDESNDFVDIAVTNFGDISFEKEIKLRGQEAFKVVKNHSWANGGYGFNAFAGSPSFNPELYQSGELDNIVVSNNGTYTVKITLGLSMYSANFSENTFDVLMIDVEKQNN